MREICYLIALFPLSAIAQSHADFNGEWRGQSQYQATVNGNVDPSAHTVTNITISIAPQGKIVGESPEYGCSLLGIAVPGLAPTVCLKSRNRSANRGHNPSGWNNRRHNKPLGLQPHPASYRQFTKKRQTCDKVSSVGIMRE